MGKPPFHTPFYLFGSTRPGSGKSSLVVNLALFLHGKGKKVAIIDANHLSPSQVSALLPRSMAIERFADFGVIVNEESPRFKRTFVISSPERLSFFPAHKNPDLRRLFADASGRDLLMRLRSSFDHVLINLPPGMPGLGFIEHVGLKPVYREGPTVCLLVTLPEMESCLEIDRLLRERPALQHVLNERMVVVFNKISRATSEVNLEHRQLGISDIKAILRFPLSFNLPLLDELKIQAGMQPSAVNAADSSGRQVLAGLTRYLANLAEGEIPWDSETAHPDVLPCHDPEELQHYSPLLFQVQKMVAQRLFLTPDRVSAYLEREGNNLRVRVRLTGQSIRLITERLGLKFLPPGEKTVRLSPSAYRNRDLGALGQENYHERMKRPGITVKPVYQFDDRFASQIDFGLRQRQPFSFELPENPLPESFPFNLWIPEIPDLTLLLGMRKKPKQVNLLQPSEEAYELYVFRPYNPAQYPLATNLETGGEFSYCIVPWPISKRKTNLDHRLLISIPLPPETRTSGIPTIAPPDRSQWDFEGHVGIVNEKSARFFLLEKRCSKYQKTHQHSPFLIFQPPELLAPRLKKKEIEPIPHRKFSLKSFLPTGALQVTESNKASTFPMVPGLKSEPKNHGSAGQVAMAAAPKLSGDSGEKLIPIPTMVCMPPKSHGSTKEAPSGRFADTTQSMEGGWRISWGAITRPTPKKWKIRTAFLSTRFLLFERQTRMITIFALQDQLWPFCYPKNLIRQKNEPLDESIVRRRPFPSDLSLFNDWGKGKLEPRIAPATTFPSRFSMNPLLLYHKFQVKLPELPFSIAAVYTCPKTLRGTFDPRNTISKSVFLVPSASASPGLLGGPTKDGVCVWGPSPGKRVIPMVFKNVGKHSLIQGDIVHWPQFPKDLRHGECKILVHPNPFPLPGKKGDLKPRPGLPMYLLERKEASSLHGRSWALSIPAQEISFQKMPHRAIVCSFPELVFLSAALQIPRSCPWIPVLDERAPFFLTAKRKIDLQLLTIPSHLQPLKETLESGVCRPRMGKLFRASPGDPLPWRENFGQFGYSPTEERFHQEPNVIAVLLISRPKPIIQSRFEVVIILGNFVQPRPVEAIFKIHHKFPQFKAREFPYRQKSFSYTIEPQQRLMVLGKTATATPKFLGGKVPAKDGQYPQSSMDGPQTHTPSMAFWGHTAHRGNRTFLEGVSHKTTAGPMVLRLDNEPKNHVPATGGAFLEGVLPPGTLSSDPLFRPAFQAEFTLPRQTVFRSRSLWTPPIITPRRLVGVKKPNVLEVLFQNLRERGRHFFVQGVEYRLAPEILQAVESESTSPSLIHLENALKGPVSFRLQKKVDHRMPPPYRESLTVKHSILKSMLASLSGKATNPFSDGRSRL